MIHTFERNSVLKNNRGLIALALVVVSMLPVTNALAVTAVPALFMEQSTSITGVSDTLKASRVPVRNNTGAIKYYDVTFKLQLDSAGIPVLAPFSPVVSLSPALLSAAFQAGKYKDSYGNVYTVTGPGATTAGRTNWNVLMTKPSTSPSCTGCTFDGSWTTGPIAGHPLQTKIAAQGIALTAYSWGTTKVMGTVSSSSESRLGSCSDFDSIVGFVQVGNQLTMHGFCGYGSKVETTQFTLSLCTATNPCP
jgi:hypothetical protein